MVRSGTKSGQMLLTLVKRVHAQSYASISSLLPFQTLLRSQVELGPSALSITSCQVMDCQHVLGVIRSSA